MWKSYIASQIDNEYKRKKVFEKKQRQKCIENESKQCDSCKYNYICLDGERKLINNGGINANTKARKICTEFNKRYESKRSLQEQL